jgi:formylglycine-generating enzyme
MKTQLGLLLLMLLIAVGCDDSTQTEPAAEQPQPESVPADPPVIELPSVTNTIGMTLNKIPAGTFIMGSEDTEGPWPESQHKVTISKPFYMQTTEVTQRQWQAVMGTEPWKGKSGVKEGPNYASTFVSWDDAIAYCKKLSEAENKTYRLPTEAEWEYACRAGTQTTWSFGNDEKALGDYAWYEENAYDIGERYAHQVGLKKPNAFGLYDTHGNVVEWCSDYYDGAEDYYKQSPEKDPTGPAQGAWRVVRGGSWGHDARRARSANRGRFNHRDRADFYGFRLVRELD